MDTPLGISIKVRQRDHVTAVLPDLDVLRDLDFDHEQTCTAPLCRSERPPARWRITFGNCGCIHFGCDPCTVRLRSWLERNAGHLIAVRCRVCGTRHQGPVEGLATTIEPLP